MPSLIRLMSSSAVQANAAFVVVHATAEPETSYQTPFALRVYVIAGQEMMGSRYWFFTVNELGQMDIGAQLDYIDRQKREELLPDKTRLQQEGGKPSRKRAHRPSLR